MNSAIAIILRFLVLLLVQVLLLNNLNFLGFINPYIYLLFILVYPVKSNQLLFLLSSFCIGIAVDVFLDSGAIHAASCVFIAYLRPILLKFTFGAAYEYQVIKFDNCEISQKLMYFFLSSLIHHFVLFSLMVFSYSRIILVLKLTFCTAIFTTIICALSNSIFTTKK